MASPTPNLGMTYPARGGSVGTWDTPLDTNFDTLDAVIGATTSVAAAGTGATLTQTQANARRISITGVLTQNYLLTFPAIGGEWVVANGCTGNFTVTLKVTGSAVTAITINQGDNIVVSSNGTDLFQALSGGTWSGATFAGADTSPSSFSTNQNDYSPTSASTTSCYRLNVTGVCSLTGIAGGAAGRELELINIGTATLKCPANSVSSAAANRFANTFNLFPGQSITLRYDNTSLLWRPKNVATAFSSCAMAAVSPDLLIVNHTGTENTKIDITASEALLVDASGNGIKFESISVTIDSTTTGPGGCDTGTRAASTAYFEWLVSDGVNINAVGSASNSAATVLTNLTSSGFSGYIYFKRVGWNVTNSSSNFQRIRQAYRHAQYVVSSATTTAYPTLGTTTSLTLAAVSLSTLIIPSTAVGLYFYGGSNAATAAYASPNGLTSGSESSNPSPFNSDTGHFPSLSGFILLETFNIYGAIGGGQTLTFFAVGWEDSI